mmetsp:Transcript_16980/g.46489  ORF Transcript_16980/g.46489 Transcript_16980/m.46489 type:complete len:142 (+) Transcript_16980:24-449(+)
MRGSLRCCVAVLLGLLDSCRLQSLSKSTYVIGGFSSEPPSIFLQKWRPLFEEYLTETVGNSYSPNVSFELIPVDYTASSAAKLVTSKGLIDFIYTHPIQLVCLESTRSFTIIGTQKSFFSGKGIHRIWRNHVHFKLQCSDS